MTMIIVASVDISKLPKTNADDLVAAREKKIKEAFPDARVIALPSDTQISISNI